MQLRTLQPEELAERAAKGAEAKALCDDYQAKRNAKAADEENAKINHSIRYKFILKTDMEASQGSKLTEQQNMELTHEDAYVKRDLILCKNRNACHWRTQAESISHIC